MNFRTTCGRNKFFRENKNNYLCKPNNSKDSLALSDSLNIFIKNKPSDQELASFIKNKDIKIWFKSKLLPYIVKRSYTLTIDTLIFNDVAFKNEILYFILEKSVNINLYDRYCLNDPDDKMFDFCLSLHYCDGPNNLSNHIIEDIDKTRPNKYLLRNFCDEIYHNDSSKNFRILKYIIEYFNLSLTENKLPNNLSLCVSEDDFLTIIELLLTNSDLSKVKFNTITYTIIRICSLHNIKFFISKYFGYFIPKLKVLFVSRNLDIFLYLVELVGFENINEKYFENNYMDITITKWLIENGFKVRPYIGTFYNINHTMLILTDAVLNNDYAYIKKYTDQILQKIFKDINYLDQFLSTTPIEMYDLNILFEILAIDYDLNLWHKLLPTGAKINNVDNVIHDLKLFDEIAVKADSTARNLNTIEYIYAHPELFYQ